jgi:phytol kinase
MHGDLAGVVLSVALIGVCMGFSFVIARYGKKTFGKLCPEVARKMVHIGVSNWFFIYAHVFETDLWPILGLAGFAVINAVMNVTGGLGKVMGQDSRKRNWGLVQYPLSIILLIALKHFGVGDMVCVGCGILGMGYGDGLASLVGMKVRSHRLPGRTKKTVAGTLTMALVTSAVVVILNLAYRSGADTLRVVLIGLLTGICSAVVEAYTPFGLDNISVPLMIHLLSGLV